MGDVLCRCSLVWAPVLTQEILVYPQFRLGRLYPAGQKTQELSLMSRNFGIVDVGSFPESVKVQVLEFQFLLFRGHIYLFPRCGNSR